MSHAREQADRILDETAPGDEATGTALKAAHVYAMLAVADAVSSLQDLIAEIASDLRRER